MANGLAAMLAKQKAKGTDDVSSHVAGVVPEIKDSGVGAEEWKSEAPPKSNPFAKPNPFASKKEDSESQAVAAAKPSLLNRLGNSKPESVQDISVSETDIGSLDDLANFEGGIDDSYRDATTPSKFADETPATAPIRELPEGLDKQQMAFVESLDTVYSMVHDPDLLGSIVKSIMIELKSNPQYINSDWKKSLVQPDDIRLWIRGMRDSMGMARLKKIEKKSKTTSGPRKSKAVDADMMSGLDDILGDMGIDV